MPPARPITDARLHQACAKLESAIAAHATLCASIQGPLPLPHADAMMDDIEDHLDIIEVKLARAIAALRAVRTRGEVV